MAKAAVTARAPFLREGRRRRDFDSSLQPSAKGEQLECLHTLGFVERRENVILLGRRGVGRTPCEIAGGVAARGDRADARASYAVASALCLAASLLAGCHAAEATGPNPGGGSGSPVVASGATVAAAVTVSCALGSGGQAYCWGSNVTSGGALGNPAVMGDTTLPVAVASDHRYAAVFLGHTTTLTPVTACALTVDGAADCWGGDRGDYLGPADAAPCGTAPCIRSPRPLATALRFRRLAVGDSYVCGIATDGGTYCWGTGARGQLGNGTASAQAVTTPTAVSGGFRFVDVTASAGVACGVTSEGAAYCWGDNTFTELGTGATAGATIGTTPVRANTTPFAHLSAADRAVCGVPQAGGGACWGWGAYWTLGAAANPVWFRNANVAAPEALALPSNVRSLTFGGAHACGLSTAGAAVCWGWNPYNQVGATGRAGCSGVGQQAVCLPAADASGLAFAELHAGAIHTCGRTTDGAVACWGNNTFGQVSGADRRPQAAPVRVVLP